MKNTDLEDKLKDAFSDFEPEVDSSLWTKISSQLPAAPPAAPTPAQPVSGLVKGLGSAASWITGTAAIILAGAGAYFYFNASEPATTSGQPAGTVQETAVERNDEMPAAAPLEEARATENNTKPASSPITETAAIAESAPSPIHSNDEKPAAASAVTAPEGNPMAPVKAPKPEIPAQVAPAAQTHEQQAGETEAVPLKVIVNVAGGFAPLRITALSNIPDAKAAFDFGDGNSDNGTSVHHTYTNPGLYSLTCTLGDQASVKEIEVLEPLPTAFSPNGDGANDLFTINSPDIRELEIRIVTRSGRLAYTGKGQSLSWNGQFADGRPAETGTYFYDIFVTSARGNVYRQKGTLTLFR